MVLELAVPAVLSLIQSLLPTLSTAAPSIVTSTIGVLTEYGPLVFKSYKALKPIVVDALDMLSSNPTTNEEQKAQIATLRAAIKVEDAAFDASLARARAEDAADNTGQN